MQDTVREMNGKNDYYRIFLNYPSFYSTCYNVNGIDGHKRMSQKIMTRVLGAHTRFRFETVMPTPVRRFCEDQSFRYSDEIEQLFDYCENIIFYNLREYLNDKGNGARLCVERVMNFGYYNRFINIVKSKELFDKVKIYDKHKKIQLMGCAASTDLDIFDEFDYDNYVRIAFQDWNVSIIGLIGNSTNRRIAMKKNIFNGGDGDKRWKLLSD